MIQKTEVKKKKANGRSILRVNVASEWEARQLSLLLKSLDRLYRFYQGFDLGMKLLLHVKQENVKYNDPTHNPLHRFAQSGILQNSFSDTEDSYFFADILPVPEFLQVKRISINSPGFTDLTGVSGIIGHLKDILFNYLPNKKAKEELKILELERQALQIKNLREMGFDSLEIKKIVLQEEIHLHYVGALIDDGKITSVEELQE